MSFQSIRAAVDAAAALTRANACLLKSGAEAMTGPLAMGNQKITGLAAGVATGEAARYDDVNAIVDPLGLYSITNFSVLPAGWTPLRAPQSGDALATSHTWAAGGLTLKSKSVSDAHSGTMWWPIGIAKQHNKKAYTCTVKFSACNLGDLGAGKGLYLTIAHHWIGNSTGTEACFGSLELYGMKGANPVWFAKKGRGAMGIVNKYSDATTLQAAEAPDLTAWGRLEVDETQGFKCWVSADGNAYTECGGGAAPNPPTGYFDPRGQYTTSNAISSALLPVLIIGIGVDADIATRAQAVINSITFTGVA